MRGTTVSLALLPVSAARSVRRNEDDEDDERWYEQLFTMVLSRSTMRHPNTAFALASREKKSEIRTRL